MCYLAQIFACALEFKMLIWQARRPLSHFPPRQMEAMS